MPYRSRGRSIRALVRDRRGHHPDAGQLHLASIEQAKDDIEEFRTRRNVIPVQTHRAADPVIAIDLEGALDLKVDVLEASSQIDHDVLPVQQR